MANVSLINFKASAEMQQEIRRFQLRSGILVKSEAIRMLLRKGLDVEKANRKRKS